MTPKSRDLADAIELTFYCGARYNELKTFRVKRVALAERRIIVLAKPLVFNVKNARKLWEWVRAQIGRTDVCWHDLRHSHGTILGKTTDVRIIKTQLGHTNVSTTLRYVHTGAGDRGRRDDSNHHGAKGDEDG
jgi:site-specific recombinase XerC